MKRQMKFFVMFAVIALVVALGVVMATSVFAKATADGFVYEVNEGGDTVTITDYTGGATEIIIPSIIDGKKVTDIGDLAFSTGDEYDTTTTKIVIPDTVEYIGAQAFMNKRAITEIIIPDSVMIIEDEAFFKCVNVEKISIGSAVEYIGFSAFGRASQLTDLTVADDNMYFEVENDVLVDLMFKMALVGEQVETVIIPDGVEAIDDFAFYGPGKCMGNIKTVIIPDGVVAIGTQAFDCTNVSKLVLPKSLQYMSNAIAANTPLHAERAAECGVEQGAIYYEGTEAEYNAISKGSSNGAITGSNSAPKYFNSCIADYTDFAHDYSNDTCDNICDNCDKITREVSYEHSYVDDVCKDCGAVISDKYVYDYTDNGDNTVTINKYLGNDTEIIIPSELDGKTVIAIGNNAFDGGEEYDEVTTKITIPDTVLYIGYRAFYNCRALTEIVIPDSVIYIEDEAFFKCINVKELTIGANLSYVGARALARMHALTDVNIADGNMAFELVDGCLVDVYGSTVISSLNISNIKIPEGIVEIADCAFYSRTNLTSIVIPDGVTYIGQNAFDGTPLTKLVLPKSVDTIEYAAFANGGNALRAGNVYYEGTSFADVWIGTANNNLLLSNIHYGSCMVASNHKHAYGSALCDNVCDFCNKITRSVSATHNYVDGVCADCGAVYEEVSEFDYVINSDGSTVTITGYLGISNEINIPETIAGMKVTAIGDNAFSGGEAYDEVTTKITIPDTVEYIGYRAFYNCRALTEIIIPDSVVVIEEEAFFKCVNVSSLKIGKNVFYVGDRALARMHALTDVTIAEGNELLIMDGGCLINVDENAVITTLNISNITIPEGVEVIADCAFYHRRLLTNIVIPDGVVYIGQHAFDSSTIASVVIPKSVDTIVNAAFANTENLKNGGNVYYEGTEEDYVLINWVLHANGTTQNNNIIAEGRAIKHFNCCMVAEDYIHVYSAACDTVCNECGKETREAAGEHAYGEYVNTDADQHWKECACGDMIEIAAHEYDNACDAICNTCSYVREANHSYSNTWSTDGINHWRECTVCHTEKADEGTHSGGNATCQAKKECAVCHLTYGEVIPCEFVENTGDRYLVSAATCKAKAVYKKSCSMCGAPHESETFEYGEIDKTNHVGGTADKDGSGHWTSCACGEIVGKTAHEYGDWTVTKEASASEKGSREKSCKDCGYKLTEEIPMIEDEAPQTGVKSNIPALVALLAIAGVSAAIVIDSAKKKNND